jgi:uncharacterized protein
VDELDDKPESLDRYWDPELEALGEFLDQMWDDGAMDLEELDGFFAALHCCPELVLPSEYFPVILGSDDALENEELFPNLEAVQLFFGLISHHWNAVGDAFRSGDFFMPLLLEDDEGKAYGNSWALGFLRGADMRKELWREILDDEDKMGWFVPLFALVHENDPDPELRSYKEPVTDELREKLLAGLSVMVTEMYRYFAPHRERNAAANRDQALFGRQKQKAGKIGRNDPCYCGSGKKYKKCCGAIKVN